VTNILRRFALFGIASFIAVVAAFGFSSSSSAEDDGGYKEIVVGDPNAPVTIIEYASLTCGHCAKFHMETLPELQKEFIDTGKAKLVYRDFPLDNLAFGAALLPRCAPEASSGKLLKVLFKNQMKWARAEDPLAVLKGYARLAGLAEDDVMACLDNKDLISKVQSVQAEAQNVYGIRSTPTFFIGEEKIEGSATIDAFKDAIEAAAK